MRIPSLKLPVLIPLLAVVYFLGAELGLALAGDAKQVTLVWPPSAIAIVALILFGYRAWPGIWIGAFAANALTGESVVVAMAIATGNTLEASAGAWLLDSVAGFDRHFRRPRDVVALGIAAAISSTVAATIGVASLCAGGHQPWSSFLSLWGTWCFGDAMGVMLLAPVLFTSDSWVRSNWRRSSIAEAAALVAGLFLLNVAVLADIDSGEFLRISLKFLAFPFVMWAALRFDVLLTALVILLTACMAIAGTVGGHGPFSGQSVDESLTLVHVFLAVLSVTGLLLASAMADQAVAARRRQADRAITHVLADSVTLAEAAPRMLRSICLSLGWDLGILWEVDPTTDVLRCRQAWRASGIDTEKFEQVSRDRAFTPGIGLPGRIWSTGEPSWISDIAADPNFPRAPSALLCGLRSAFGFPIVLGAGTLSSSTPGNEDQIASSSPRVVGVIEVFSREVQQPDADLLQMFSTIGKQIGQFIGRKTVEEAVAESELRMRAILESSCDGLITMNAEGRITEFNPAAEAMFGWSRAEAVGTILAERIIPERLRERHRRGLQRYLQTGEHSILGRRLELVALRKDGTEFPVEIAIIAIHSGGQAFFSGYARDISDRQRMEEERSQLLRRERAARIEADAANRSKDEFLATVSHELRTPLNAMLGWARLLREGKLDDPNAAHAIDTIERNARAQSQIIDDILDVSRIVTGKIRLDPRPVDLTEVLETAIDSVKPTADAKGVLLERALQRPGALMEGDTNRIQQIIWNLLTNAIRFTPRGGRVTVRLSSEGRIARIDVTDTGAGISPELLPHVFDRFRQADSSTTRAHRGLGLGLAIVRHLTELHGGSVRAESDGLGHGATFTVTLPLSAASTSAGPSPPMPAAVSAPLQRMVKLAGLRLLVVDDEADARELIAALLRGCDAEVRSAGSAAEAYAAVKEWKPNVMVSDIGMPVEDGYSLIQRVRALGAEAGGDVPAVALTAYVRPADRQRALAAGYHDHLKKPVDPAELLVVVARLAGRAEVLPPPSG